MISENRNSRSRTYSGIRLLGRDLPTRSVHRPRISTKRKKIAIGVFLGALAAAMAFALIPSEQASAFPTRTGGSCAGVNCHPTTSVSFMTVTGFPSGSYVPGMNYSITLTVLDASTEGDNNFNFIVSAGSLGTLDPDTRVISTLQVAADVTTTNSWSFYWVAPASGSVTADAWAVDGSNIGRDAPYEHQTFGVAEIPEFGILFVPIAGILGVLILAKRLKSR